MPVRQMLRWGVFLIVPLLLAGCAQQTVKGNIYRKGFKEGKLTELIARFEKGSFAIFPFKGIAENRTVGIATDGNAIADLMSIQMLYQGYNVLERDKMQKLLEEKAFKESDLAAAVPVPVPAPVVTDSTIPAPAPVPAVIPAPVVRKPSAEFEMMKQGQDNTEQYVRLGRMLGVDFIVSGSIIQYEYEMSKGGSIKLAVTITTRVIDVESGDIILALSAGTCGDNLPEALDGITMAFTDALKEGKVYVWE